jgi:hypothetical protein
MLSEGQQRLLHAWVDGECTEAESRTAVDLLTRPEASEYVSELKRLRELVARHAGIYAPAGLLERVREALRREVRQGSVVQLFAWRVAGLAAAAALVIAAGIVVAPMLTQPTVEPSQIAGQPQPLISGAPVPDVADDLAEDIIKEEHAKVTDPRPMPPADEVAAGLTGRASNVLRLDRGVDQPLEISVHMDRASDARNLQVYNDLLIVSCLYGDAELKDGAVSSDLPGRDFSEYEGVAVEVEADRVPELIAALDRLAADQQYGEVVVPGDLRESSASSTRSVKEMQGLAWGRDAKLAKGSSRADGARTYLPPEVQREFLEQELKDVPEALKRLSELESRRLEDRQNAPDQRKSEDKRKVKLVLRLR